MQIWENGQIFQSPKTLKDLLIKLPDYLLIHSSQKRYPNVTPSGLAV